MGSCACETGSSQLLPAQKVRRNGTYHLLERQLFSLRPVPFVVLPVPEPSVLANPPFVPVPAVPQVPRMSYGLAFQFYKLVGYQIAQLCRQATGADSLCQHLRKFGLHVAAEPDEIALTRDQDAVEGCGGYRDLGWR